MKESNRWFDLQSHLGETVEISLENGAIFRGILDYEGHGDNYYIRGHEGNKGTLTEFDKADLVCFTLFQ